MSPATGDLEAGTMVGAYRVTRRIGGGAMGTVYAALEPTIGKEVAIKVMRPALAEDDTFVARFEREARAVNATRHPGIIDVFAFGRLPDGRAYFVMSLLEGRSLAAELTARGRLPLAEAWAIARDVASALAAAHEAGIVHRDLKPDNVFLEAIRGGGARPRVLDFGVAKAETTRRDEAALTGSGVILGTPAYMAPEQWWRARVDGRTDQYALGVMLFEMLTGRTPFDPQHPDGIMRQHLHVLAPAVTEHCEEASEAVARFVTRLLAKDPADRFASMDQVVSHGDRVFGSAAAMASAEPIADSAPAVTAAESAAAATTVADAAPLLAADGSAATTVADRLGTATAITEAGTTTADPRSGGQSPTLGLRRYYLAHAAVVATGIAGLYAVGYTGQARREVLRWFYLAGFLSWLVLGAFAAAAVGQAVAARRRAKRGGQELLLLALALAPGALGALCTYANWQAVKLHIVRHHLIERFAYFAQGAYESGLSRFLGFSYSATLCLGVVVLLSVSPLADQPGTLPAERRVQGRRLEVGAFAFALVLGSIAVALGAPSGALPTFAAAMALGLGLAFPARGGRAQLVCLLAATLSVAFASGVALVRLDGRSAIVWAEQPTRSARVQEILAAEGERVATWPLILAALFAVLVPAFVRLRALYGQGALRRPRLAALWPLGLLTAAALGDAELSRRFDATGEQIRAQLAPQFKLFARLDPPADPQLPPERFAPHRATALQITRDVVAINGHPVARLTALSSSRARTLIHSELASAMAEVAAGNESPAPAAPDLSCSLDRQVAWPLAQQLLGIAYEAGARQVELLLTRGPSPELPTSGPPELGYLLASDFVAIRVELGPEGYEGDPQRSFGELAPALVERARNGEVVLIRVSGPQR